MRTELLVLRSNTFRPADHFFILDFDRTLGNTTALYQLFQRILESVIDIAAVRQLDSARHSVEDRGGSFDSAYYVRDILARAGKADSWSTIVDEFIRCASENDSYLEPSARYLLEYLDTWQCSYGIVTYGGEAWQRLKIQAVGMGDIPSVVTQTQEKGKLIRSWIGNDGRFIIPGDLNRDGRTRVVSAVTLIDDNQLNFVDLPDVVSGYYIQNSATRQRSGVVHMGPSVRQVTHLDEVIKMLNHDIDKT